MAIRTHHDRAGLARTATGLRNFRFGRRENDAWRVASGTGSHPGRVRLVAVLLLSASIVAACGATARPSSSIAAPATPSSAATPSPSASVPTEERDGGRSLSPSSAGSPDAVAALAGALEAAGAEVSLTGSFASDPIGGEGVGLCVDGQVVNVYVFPSVETRAAVASRIDPHDPSNIGTSIVTWIGTPRFWQAERVIVLYLGRDPAVDAGLTSILGEAFARGEGAPAAGPDLSSC